jgi:hypothetical protein
VESNKPSPRIIYLLRIACWASFAVYKSIAGDITSRTTSPRATHGKAGNSSRKKRHRFRQFYVSRHDWEAWDAKKQHTAER